MNLLPRDPQVITDPEELAQAAVEAFLNGDARTRQHIVDTLGDRAASRMTRCSCSWTNPVSAAPTRIVRPGCPEHAPTEKGTP